MKRLRLAVQRPSQLRLMRQLVLTALAIGLCVVCIYLYLLNEHMAEADPMADLATIPPTAATLHHLVTQMPPNAPTTPGARSRYDVFAEQLTARFRHHEPIIAVRIRFLNDSLIGLMCPARMEPWNTDRLAMTVWREAKDDLGRAYDIDIFETFIGTMPIKIGELRNPAGPTPVAQIRYRTSSMLSMRRYWSNIWNVDADVRR